MKYIVSSCLYLLALFCLSTFIFDPSNLYYELPWLDIPMHIMGGFGVASLSLAISTYKNKKLNLVHILTLYACVAIAWELYELMNDLMSASDWNGWVDTIADFINGALGAASAYYLLKK